MKGFMIQFLARRLIHLIVVAFAISLIIFVLIRLVPGDPITGILGSRASPDAIAALKERLGLGKPLFEQYLVFLGNAIRGDLGDSYIYHKAVTEIIIGRLPLTLGLIAYSMTLAVLVAVPLGIVASLRRETLFDNAIRGLLLLGNAIPAYWLGTVLILAFVLVIPIFPISPPTGATPLQLLWALFLPAFTTSVGLYPPIARALRASLIESVRTDHILLARSKGLSERAVFLRHAFRLSLIPAVTIIGISVSFLIGGQIVVESVFGLPGLGQLMLHAVETRDYPLVTAATLIFAVLVVVINTIADIIVGYLDPRARLIGSHQ